MILKIHLLPPLPLLADCFLRYDITPVGGAKATNLYILYDILVYFTGKGEKKNEEEQNFLPGR